jgi:phosphatidate phosphatase APP1
MLLVAIFLNDMKGKAMALLRKMLLLCERLFDRIKGTIQSAFGMLVPTQIMAYHWYGTRDYLEIRGRVVKNKGIQEARREDSPLDNMVNMYKRLESDELAGVELTATYQGSQVCMVSNEEGYFQAVITPSFPLDGQKLWHEVALCTSEVTMGSVEACARVLVPSEESVFGVISDVDDTIIKTGIASLFDTIGNTFLKNAQTRCPFEGVREFYTALQTGKGRRRVNPLFYISNSPWNLFDFIDEFMRINRIPVGPILLRDFGLDQDKFIIDHNHKRERIEEILRKYPNLHFVLIGDSGEKDPEIYQQVCRIFPDRIIAVYIRDVTSAPRDSAVREIAAEVTAQGIDMILVEDTGEAAEHAASIGLISEEALATVQQAVKR